MPANSQTCGEGSWNGKAFTNGYRQKEQWLSVVLAWVRKAWEESRRITERGKKRPGESVCALSAFFSSDFKVPLLPKCALVSWGERARGASLALKIKQILEQSLPGREGGKVPAVCPVPFRWRGLLCFEYYSSEFLNSGNPPNPSL